MPRKIEKTVYTFGELLKLAEEGKVNERAVTKARQWMEEASTDGDWWEYTYDDWQKACADVGFPDPEINFSGFGSQGDGASFVSVVDLPVLIEFLSAPPEGTQAPVLIKESPETYDWRSWVVNKVGGVKGNPKFRKVLRIIDSVEMAVKRHTRQYSHGQTCGVESDFRDNGEYVKFPAVPAMLGMPFKPQESVWKSKQPRLRALWDEFVKAAEELRLDICHAIYQDLEEEYESRTTDEYLSDMSEANDWTFDENGRADG
jgi:hypothetical protein